MDDASKSNEEMPEAPAEETKDEKVEEPQPKSEVRPKETSEEQIEEEPKTPEAKEDSVEGPEKPKKEEKPVEAEIKKETKKDEPKKKDRKDDFKYIIRIANTDIDGEKTLVRGLTSIKGVGMHMSTLITDTAGINRDIKVGDLTDAQIDKIKEALHNVNKNAPGWMLNHRRDCNTGEDIHLISSDIDMQLRDDINIMKKIRSYRGIRHERNLRVRGQRTRANSRKGLALGVSRREAREASKEARGTSSSSNKKE